MAETAENPVYQTDLQVVSEASTGASNQFGSEPDEFPEKANGSDDETFEVEEKRYPDPYAWGSLQSAQALKEGDVDAFVLRWCQNACASNWLDPVVLTAIIINTILLALENPANTLSEDTLRFMVIVDLVLTVGFHIEMQIRITAMGWWDRAGSGTAPNIVYDPCYMNDDWNKLDFFVVITSWINVLVDVTGAELPFSMSTLRALRILRVLKAFKKIEGIRQILGTIGQALPYSANVIAFLMFLFVVSGIIGVQMFRGATRNRCEYSSFNLQAHLEPNKYPLTNSSFGNKTSDYLGATLLGNYHPWPQPMPVVEKMYEYPIGIGVWTTYCSTDLDCPLYAVDGMWNQVQTCQPSLNPGKNFQNYDSIGDAWVSLFINMANLYWWEVAHRYVDSNRGFSSSISWGFGVFNVFFLTYVTVNMFVAVITTVFMDVRTSAKPDAGMGGERETLAEEMERKKAELAAQAAKWTEPCYYVAAFGGKGPFVEPVKGDPLTPEEYREKDVVYEDPVGLIWHPYFDKFILGWIFINTYALFADHHDATACDDAATLVIEMQSEELCQEQWFIDANVYANYVFNAIFTAECIMKICGMSFKQYIRLPFNQLDFFIVVTSALDMLGEMVASEGDNSSFAVFKQFRVFRLFRVLRVARILYKNENLKRVLITVFGSGEAIANLIMFILFSTLLFAILGMHLTGGLYNPENNPSMGYGDNSGSLYGRMIGDGSFDVREPIPGAEKRFGYDVTTFIRMGLIPRRNFEDFPRAFLLSFQIMTGDDWVNQMHDVMEVKGGIIPVLIFFANFGFCNFILLSLFIAVILENFEVAEAKKAELQKIKYEKDKEMEVSAANKPKITFAHRLAWLFGGDGGQSGFGMAIDLDKVELDKAGQYGPRDAAGNPTDFGTILPGQKWYNDDKSLFMMGPHHRVRTNCRALAENSIFDFAILMAIITGTVMLAIEGPPGAFEDRCVAVDKGVCKDVMLDDSWQLHTKMGWGEQFNVTGTGAYTDVFNATDFNVSATENRNLCEAAGACAYNVANPAIGLPQKCKAQFLDICNGANVKNGGEVDREASEANCDAIGAPCSFGYWKYWFDLIQLGLFALFMVEFVSKVVGYGFMFTPESYLKNGWNRLDFVVIVGSILNMIPGVDAGFVKLLRCLRPLRLINRNEGMRVIISAVLNSLAVNIGVLALSGLGLLIFAILGVGMFAGQMYTCNCGFVYPQGVTPNNAVFDANGGWTIESVYNPGPLLEVRTQQHCIGENTTAQSGGRGAGGIYGLDPSYPDTISECFWDNRPYNFDTATNAMMALFSASTLAGWTDIMEIGLDSTGIGMQPIPFSGYWYFKIFYFLLYVIVMSFFVTNLFVGVLIDFISNSDGSALLTEAQQAAADLQKFKTLHRPSKREIPPENQLRAWFYGLVESGLWDTWSNGFILFNVAVMMCEYEDQSPAWWNALEFLNAVCLWFFTIEMFFKLIAYFPRKYWKDPWSKFDATVITLSWAAVILDLEGAQAIRALRAMRIILVLKSAKGIRSLFQTLILSIAPGTNISVLLLLLYSLYAMIGMMLFGNVPVQDVDCAMEEDLIYSAEYCQWEDPELRNFTTMFSGISKGKPGQVLLGLNRQYTHHSNFRSFGSAMRLLFQCAAGQDWKFVMYAVGGEPGQPGSESGLAFIFFLSFLFLSNYILLNLFVAVILDNFSASMREQELDISEQDFEMFKFLFREFTSDATPETLNYRALWPLMAKVGSTPGHDDNGELIETVLSPPPYVEWDKGAMVSWKLAKGMDAEQECPSNVKDFLHSFYDQEQSPLQNSKERVGITFAAFYTALMSAPANFETAEVNTAGPWAPETTSLVAPEASAWEEFRGSIGSATGKGQVPYDVIEWACRSLRFRIHYGKLCNELRFHGSIYTNESSTVSYNDLLQGLVNVTLGDAGLSLEDKMKREAEAEGGDERFREANWIRILEQNEKQLVKQVAGARLNPNVTAAEMSQLESDLADVRSAIMEANGSWEAGMTEWDESVVTVDDVLAITRIQATQRGKQERKDLAEQKAASVRIQAIQRGKQVRRDVEEQKEAVTKIQAVARGKASRATTADS